MDLALRSNSAPASSPATTPTWLKNANWDFLTDGNGLKPAFIEKLTSQGCVIRASEPIEFRRSLRMVFREGEGKVAVTVVGRVVRREYKLEAWDDENFTLYRYGIEFTRPISI